jgi:peroxiredoxin
MTRAYAFSRSLAALACAAVVSAAGAATPGTPAPEFTVVDATGKAVKLADFRGKYVVLEWTNPDCPFVQRHYNSKNMPDLQKEWGAKDVVWLSVNSTREGHGEYYDGRKMQAWMTAKGATPNAVLIDGKSEVGRAYAAKTTPHMFVIAPDGKVLYNGAIDDKRGASQGDTKSANNYVRAALTEAKAGKPVAVASTTPYGCSIKY